MAASSACADTGLSEAGAAGSGVGGVGFFGFGGSAAARARGGELTR
ncbi:hypothetical protein HMPREF9581_01295 [Cutibacterium acnes HL087PA3]|nr:hypothetical protein HMPREF9581_01295 [Cutibacterium acnes HL087PA3]